MFVCMCPCLAHGQASGSIWLSTAEPLYPVVGSGPNSSCCCPLPCLWSVSWVLKVLERVGLGRGLRPFLRDTP